jgi:drug/metabolite transporter (DMT)-like permease
LSLQIIGAIAALVSAFSWALCDVLWRRVGEEISPWSINFGKTLIGSFYLVIFLCVGGIEAIAFKDFMLLSLSGLVGIALGDTLFFMSLMQIGPRLSSLMGSLASVFIVFSAVVFLGERLSLMVWVGIFLTVGGVTWLLWEHSPQANIIRNKSLGVKYGLLSILCMTIGVLFAKVGVVDVSPIQATFIRLFWGVIGLVLWGGMKRELKNWIRPFKVHALLKKVSLIAFVGTFGGFWLSLFSLKYVDASIASTLNATTPLFILPLVAIMLRERISLRAFLGAVIVVGGVALILRGG